MFPDTPVEDLDVIVEELPYWLRENHGKYMINRLRNFVINHGGERLWTDIEKEGTKKKVT